MLTQPSNSWVQQIQNFNSFLPSFLGTLIVSVIEMVLAYEIGSVFR